MAVNKRSFRVNSVIYITTFTTIDITQTILLTTKQSLGYYALRGHWQFVPFANRLQTMVHGSTYHNDLFGLGSTYILTCNVCNYLSTEMGKKQKCWQSFYLSSTNIHAANWETYIILCDLCFDYTNVLLIWHQLADLHVHVLEVYNFTCKYLHKIIWKKRPPTFNQLNFIDSNLIHLKVN